MANRAKAKSAKARGGKVKGKAIAKLPRQSKPKKRGIGDNSGAVPDEVKIRHMMILRRELKELASLQADVKQQNGVYRAARKLAKKEGLNLKAFDIKHELEALDQGQVHQDYADAAELIRIDDSPLLQLNLFQNMLAPDPVVDVAMEGFNAGKMAVDVAKCPYEPGSENGALWLQNWNKGQEINRQGLAV